MMAVTKYLEKSISLFAKKQSVIGVAEVLAGTDVIAMTDLAQVTENTGSSYNYLGDENNRDGLYILEDEVATVTGKTFFPVTYSAVTGSTALDIEALFEAAGGTVTAPSTETASITFGSLTNGQFVTVAGLTFTASTSVTAANVAAAFASLSNGATTGPGTSNGAYTGILAGWSSGTVSTATVVFTSSTAGEGVTDIVTAKTSGVTLTVTTTQPVYMISNSPLNQDTLTLNFGLDSAESATTKVYEAIDVMAQFDLMFEIGKTPEISWSFKGNYVAPSEETTLVQDFGVQKAVGYIAPVIRAENISTSHLRKETDISGEAVFPAVLGTKNVCFVKLSASNAFATDATRYLTGCEDGFTKKAITTDVTLTILEAEADATYNPDTSKGSRHRFYLGVGTVEGRKFAVEFTNLFLKDVKRTTHQGLNAKDLTFENRGQTKLYWL